MPQKIRVAINGFGRIGRSLFRLLLDHSQIEVVAINDVADGKTLAHLLKYDSIHGVLPKEVSFENGAIVVEDQKFSLTQQKDIEQISWDNFQVKWL